MTEREIDDRIAEYLVETRNIAGITQAGMAKKLDVSRRTIQSWETGESFPRFSKILQWMFVTRQNPIRILQEVAAPSLDRIKAEDTDRRIERGLAERINSLRITEKRDLLFILFGNHGSSVYAFLQLAVAYLHCPMGDRQNITLQVINNYKNAVAMGTIVSPENIAPDMDALEQAFQKKREAYRKGENSYINIEMKEFAEESDMPD